jgi:hypothetical protein
MRNRHHTQAPPESSETHGWAADIDARERDLLAREELLDALERRLARSRRRLDERLHAILERRMIPLATPGRLGLPRVPQTYFQDPSALDDDAWWSRQLGKPPRMAA